MPYMPTAYMPIASATPKSTDPSGQLTQPPPDPSAEGREVHVFPSAIESCEAFQSALSEEVRHNCPSPFSFFEIRIYAPEAEHGPARVWKWLDNVKE